jgi:hypothetical protein
VRQPNRCLTTAHEPGATVLEFCTAAEVTTQKPRKAQTHMSWFQDICGMYAGALCVPWSVNLLPLSCMYSWLDLKVGCCSCSPWRLTHVLAMLLLPPASLRLIAFPKGLGPGSRCQGHFAPQLFHVEYRWIRRKCLQLLLANRPKPPACSMVGVPIEHGCPSPFELGGSSAFERGHPYAFRVHVMQEQCVRLGHQSASSLEPQTRVFAPHSS